MAYKKLNIIKDYIPLEAVSYKAPWKQLRPIHWDHEAKEQQDHPLNHHFMDHKHDVTPKNKPLKHLNFLKGCCSVKKKMWNFYTNPANKV